MEPRLRIWALEVRLLFCGPDVVAEQLCNGLQNRIGEILKWVQVPSTSPINTALAQLGERYPVTVEATGSKPVRSAKT